MSDVTEQQIDHLAGVITGYRYDLYEGENTQSKSEYVYYLQQRWKPLAKRILEPGALDLLDYEALLHRQQEDAELIEKLKMEAQIHSGEARAANATLNEIYQLCSGSTGEKANWSGATPVKERLATDESLIRELVPLAEQGLRMLSSDMANFNLTINQRVTLGLLYKQAETVIQKANARLKGGVDD